MRNQNVKRQIESPDDVQQALQIDRANLADELLGQADLQFRVGRAVAETLSRRDGEKLNVDAVDAGLRRGIRAADRGDKPMSEASLARAVEEHQDHLDAVRRQMQAASEVRAWENAHEAVRARGYALHKLVDLELAFGAAIAGQSQRGAPPPDDRTQDAVRERKRRKVG